MPQSLNPFSINANTVNGSSSSVGYSSSAGISHEIITIRSVEQIAEQVIEEKLKCFFIEILGKIEEESNKNLKMSNDHERRLQNIEYCSENPYTALVGKFKVIEGDISCLRMTTLTKENLEENLKLTLISLLTEIQELKERIEKLEQK